MTGGRDGVGAGATLTIGDAVTAGGALDACEGATFSGGRDASGFGGALDRPGGRVGNAFGAGLGDALGRVGFGGALDSTEGRGLGGALDSSEGRGFGGALDSTGDPHGAALGRALESPGSPEGGGFGVELVDTAGRPESVARRGGTVDTTCFGATLVSASGGDEGVFGGTLGVTEGTESVGCGGTLDGAGRVVSGFGATLEFCASPMGTVVLTATLTGTLSDSGMSSQPESMSSSAGIARSSASREPRSAPFAILLKGTRTSGELAASNRSFVSGSTRQIL